MEVLGLAGLMMGYSGLCQHPKRVSLLLVLFSGFHPLSLPLSLPLFPCRVPGAASSWPPCMPWRQHLFPGNPLAYLTVSLKRSRR